jgi:hypothetical protein
MARRVGRHGAVSRSRLLRKDLAILAGPEAAAAFLDEQILRGPAFRLPDQDLSMDTSGPPASWNSGLRVRFGA